MSHDHAHAHHDLPQDFGPRFALGIGLNIAFVAIEAFYGWRAGSLALLADAGHNLGDVGGLALGWAGLAAGRLHASDRHTYGWQRASILASFLNAVLLLVLMGGLALEAFLHMAADALVSLGVVIGAAVVLATGWMWLDPAISLVIVAVVVWGTWSLFSQSLHLMFDGVPREVDLPAVRSRLLGLEGVLALHDLHVWALSTSKVSLTAHLVVRQGVDSAALLEHAEHMLHDAFDITHVTLQLETEDFAAHCALAAAAAACPGSAAQSPAR